MNSEHEISLCCGTTCDKEKVIRDIDGLVKSQVMLNLTIQVLSKAVKEAQVPLPMLGSDAELLGFLKEHLEKISVHDSLLREYVREFKDDWNEIDFSS